MVLARALRLLVSALCTCPSGSEDVLKNHLYLTCLPSDLGDNGTLEIITPRKSHVEGKGKPG